MIKRTVWINGTVGVGKTTVGHALAEHLAGSGDAVAFINTDDLGACWPSQPEDPFNFRVVRRNLAALADNYSTAGAATLVVAGVIQNRAQLISYSESLRVPPRLVRLVLPPATIEGRLRRRHDDFDEARLGWHLARAPELTRILDAGELSMTEVENSGVPLDTALAVLKAIAW